jgi:FkbM family methyltransferase
MYNKETGQYDTPNGRRLTFLYRTDTNDHNTLWSSLNEDEYHLRGEHYTGTALDVGGYLGSVGIALAADNPDLRVVIVEPVPPNADLIELNIAENRLWNRIELIRGAVGKGGESVDVWYGYRGSEAAEHHAFVGNSTLAYDDSATWAHDTTTYTAIGLADFIERYGPLSFLKVDAEGAEWAFLDTSRSVLEHVAVIAGEWHPVRGHTMGDLLSLLEETHVVTFDGPQAGPGGFRAVRR